METYHFIFYSQARCFFYSQAYYHQSLPTLTHGAAPLGLMNLSQPWLIRAAPLGLMKLLIHSSGRRK